MDRFFHDNECSSPSRTQEGLDPSTGATLVEYVLLVALIALAAVVGVSQFGGSISEKFSMIASSVPK